MRLPSASTRKFSSSSIMAATEHKPDTDQRILDLNLTDQGYRIGACGCCHRHPVHGRAWTKNRENNPMQSRVNPRLAAAAKGRAATFFTNVKWITYGREIPGHYAHYRAARADFNVRGWQGR
jgi:hypothetical protein